MFPNGEFLAGGFKDFLCSPLLGEMIQFDSYFSDGLVQPPPSFPFATFVFRGVPVYKARVFGAR